MIAHCIITNYNSAWVANVARQSFIYLSVFTIVFDIVSSLSAK